MEVLLAIILSYLIGSIPVGYLIARAYGIDISQRGSGNIGTTNVWRTLGPWRGMQVYIADAAKGIAAVLIGRELGTVNTELLAAAAVLVGNGWSVFLRFKGGKVIATGSGVMLALAPPVFVAALLVWLATLGIFRWVSVASLAAAATALVGLLVMGSPWQYIVFGVGVLVLAVYKHRSNISRLIKGTEPKVGNGRR